MGAGKQIIYIGPGEKFKPLYQCSLKIYIGGVVLFPVVVSVPGVFFYVPVFFSRAGVFFSRAGSFFGSVPGFS